jgi:hypothetical protein
MQALIRWGMLVGALALLAAGCEAAGGGSKPGTQTFPLTYCDGDSECGTDLECTPVFCPDVCTPDGQGGCVPCNQGKRGQCLPKPGNHCGDDVTCTQEEACVKTCVGVCNPHTGQCTDVACKFECGPAPCLGDADCQDGKVCDIGCVYGAFDPATGFKAADAAAQGLCVGTCVTPVVTRKCDGDADCAAGEVCEAVLCAMLCASDGQGGCLPCNDGFAGVCVPEPQEGCKSDADCGDGQYCSIACGATWDAFAPADKAMAPEECVGQCVGSGCGASGDCPEGFRCEQVCTACASEAQGAAYMGGDADANGMMAPPDCGQCYGQCVPVSHPDDPCNVDADCPAGQVCEPVFCTMACIPDGTGGCLPCNGGHLGTCVDRPQSGCQDDAACAPGEVCQVACTGYCDPTMGCGDQCQGVCVPAAQGCESNAECAPGFHCELMCTGACPPMPMNAAGDAMPVDPGCGDTACRGQCIQDAPLPGKCNADADCPPDQQCEAVYCADYCAADGQGGCLPCNDGFFGVCVPRPQQGCQSDAECGPGEACKAYCMGSCDPNGGCSESCQGVCVPQEPGCSDVNPCPAGQECQMVCVDCAPAVTSGTDCLGGCYGQCVPVQPEPVPCDLDSDCAAGWHCEPIFCSAMCVPDGAGGCLPCNDGHLGQCAPNPQQGCQSDAECLAGEQCQTHCMGLCDPTWGCGEQCQGVCVPLSQGCTSDAECGEGEQCDLLCPPSCAGFASDDPATGEPMPPCADAEACYGQCVPRPFACGGDQDCAAGELCSQGQCVALPSAGCMSDAECLAGQVCQVFCPMTCSAEGCTQECSGQCVNAPVM